jgi:hypothetical protein
MAIASSRERALRPVSRLSTRLVKADDIRCDLLLSGKL